jgi:hypothetical protein
MKQRQPKPRKTFQPPKRLPPAASTELPRRSSNAVLDPIGTRETPLPLREAANQANVKADMELGVSMEATVVRAAPYKEMLSWIEVLEALIAELPKQHRGIGDNLQPIGDDELHSIINLVFILKHQPVVPTAPDDVRAAGSRLKKIGDRLGTYLDTFLLEASKSGGKELGLSTMNCEKQLDEQGQGKP